MQRLFLVISVSLLISLLCVSAALGDSTIYLPMVGKPPTPTITPTATATATPIPTVTPIFRANLVCPPTGDAAQICAWVSNDSPTQNSDVTVYGRLLINGAPVSGQAMDTTWHYKTVTSYCSGVTGADGVASCPRDISRATKGYQVNIDVSIGGHIVTTWFTTR